MNKKLLKVIEQEIQQDRAVSGAGYEVAVHHFFKGEWWTGDRATAANLKAMLTEVRNEAGKAPVFRPQRILVYLDQLDAVVETRHPPRLAKKRKESLVIAIKESSVNAENRYNATHDRMTGLLNRHGFDLEFKKRLQARTRSADPSAAGFETAKPSSVGFLLFDLDHFKQLNDSFTHQYGDVVLVAFAWNLEVAVNEICTSRGYIPVLARAGGEEFEVAIFGCSDAGGAAEAAELIRNAVTKDTPSKDQFDSICRTLSYQNLKPPVEGHRKVGCSVGVAFRRADDSDSRNLYTRLQGEADVAAYRAKADGRGCVRQFVEIRNHHGRVLEFHGEDKVVAIDIGSKVGVKTNDVFQVIAPPFDGISTLDLNDGRSTRRLGIHPKMILGLISVFNVQLEVAFCNLIHQYALREIPVGSRLLRCPTGAVPPYPTQDHLQTPARWCFNGDLHGAIREGLKAGDLGFLVAVSIGSNESSSEDRNYESEGIFAKLTESLSPILSSCFSGVRHAANLRQNVGVLLFSIDVEKESVNAGAVRLREILGNEKVNWVAAVDLTPGEDDEVESEEWLGRASGLRDLGAEKLLYLLELVGISTTSKWWSNLKLEPESVVWLAPALKPRIFSCLRRRGQIEEFMVDYRRLRECGCDTDEFHNQTALVILEERDKARYPLARAALQRAIDLKPSAITYRMNMGIAECLSGRFEEGLKHLAVDQKEYRKRHWLYALAYAKAALEAYRKDKSSIKISAVRSAIRRALRVCNPVLEDDKRWMEDLNRFQKT